jgi:uridine kinase
MNTKIIGISGKTAAGKTTLAKALAKELNCTYISWDEFDEISKLPDDYVAWFNSGQNYEEFDFKELADTLYKLKSQKQVHILGKDFLPTKYIFFDAPLGRLHNQTGKYIDICFHIAVPKDILLARRLIRDFKHTKTTKDELMEELEYYLSSSRSLFFDKNLIKSADIIIDGLLSHEEQISNAKSSLFDYKEVIYF